MDSEDKKVHITIYLTPQQAARLNELHQCTKVPRAEYVREGIDHILSKYGLGHERTGVLEAVESSRTSSIKSTG